MPRKISEPLWDVLCPQLWIIQHNAVSRPSGLKFQHLMRFKERSRLRGGGPEVKAGKYFTQELAAG